jgi:hypothetical protein
MRKTAAAGAILVLLLTVSGCAADQAAQGTVRGTVVLSPPCPVEMTPVTPPTESPAPTSSDNACGGSVPGATVTATRSGSATVAATVRTGDDGRFTCDLPKGDYTFEAAPSSSSAGQGVPLDVTVAADETVEVTLRVDTGVR